MKIFFKIIITFLLTTIFAYADVFVPQGDVSGIWEKSKSPYIVGGNINVPTDSTLTIEAGVIVKFNGDFSFIINGELIAKGTIIDSIKFIPKEDNLDGWQGININTTANKAELSFCRIEGANGQGIWVQANNVLELKNSVVCKNNGNGIIISSGSAITAIIKNSIIKENTQNGIYLSKGIINIYNSLIIKNNQAGIIATTSQDKTNIFNCVISDNNGTGVISSGTNAPVNVINSIITDNNNSLSLSTLTKFINITYSDIEDSTIYPGAGNVNIDPQFADTITYKLSASSFCIDLGNPASDYNDVYFPPSMGSVRNDMGAYGGPNTWAGVENLVLDFSTLDFGPISISNPSTKSLAVKNYTNSLVSVSDVSFSGADAAFFSTTDINFMINSQDSSNIETTFSPKEGRAYNGLFTIYNDLGIIKGVLKGSGLVPVINITPTTLNFGSTIVNGDSVQQVTIKNNGQSNLIVFKDSLAISGINADQFSLDPLTEDLIIPPTSSQVVSVHFAPSDSGYKQAVLNIASNDPSNPQKQVTLSGNAIRPVISFSDSLLNFGELRVNEDSTKQIKIFNNGNTNLIVYKDSLNISGTGAAHFSVSSLSADLVIAAGDSDLLNITFAPIDSGYKEAVLNIYSNDMKNSPKQIGLSGRGFYVPKIRLSQYQFDFGDVAFNEDSVQKLKVYNDGLDKLIIYKDSLNISGTGASYFSTGGLSSNLTIPKKDSALIDIHFSPKGNGNKQAALNIISNDPDSSRQSVSLTGNGYIKPNPVIHLSKQQLNFDSVAVYQDSSMDVTIYNNGQVNLVIYSAGLKITGNDSLLFKIQEEIVSDSTISFGDSLRLNINFNPDSPGNKNAFLNIVSNDPDDSVRKIPLSGKGYIEPALLPKITVSSQVNFGNIYINKDSTQAVAIYNEGYSDLTIYKNTLKITGADSSSFSLAFIGADILVPENESRLINVTFKPLAEGAKSAKLSISCNDPLNQQLTITLTGTGVSNPLAKIQLDPAVTSSEFIKDQNAQIGFKISADSPIDSSFLCYRMGGASSFTRIALTHSNDSTWQTNIAGSQVTERGLEYYVEAHHNGFGTLNPSNGPQFPKVISVQVPLLTFPEKTNAGSYQMISFPLDINQQNLSDLLEDDLGTYDNTKYRLFDYKEDSGYVELDDLNKQIKPGKAVFLITKKSQTLDIENSKSQTTESNYQISLKAGWNFIGDPFAFPIMWSVADSNHVLRDYSSSGWGFPTVLEPYKGYAIKVTNDTTIFVPPVEANGLLKNSGGILAGSEWYFQVIGEGKKVSDKYNYAGVKPSAQNGIDKNDCPEPPPIDKYFSVSFIVNSSGENFSTDFRSPGSDGYTFTLFAQSNVSASKTLHILAQNLPDNFDWTVVSPESKIIYNKKNISITGNQKLQLLVGTESYLKNITDKYRNMPEKITLRQNYPNPFNPETTIAYELNKVVNVHIDIYNILGKRIKTLINNKLMQPGYYTIKWKGYNNFNNRVASGIYFMNFRAGNYNKTIKMILNN